MTPARRADRADAALQRRDALLQDRRGRVGNAAVEMACALQVEEDRGVIGVAEHVGRGLIDRHRARAVDRVRLLAGVQRQGVGANVLGAAHGSSPALSRRLPRLAARLARRRAAYRSALGPSSGGGGKPGAKEYIRPKYLDLVDFRLDVTNTRY